MNDNDTIYICTICHRELPLPPAYCGIEPPQGYNVGGYFCGDCLGIGREYSKRNREIVNDYYDKLKELRLEFIDKLNSLKPPSSEIIDFFKDWQF